MLTAVTEVASAAAESPLVTSAPPRAAVRATGERAKVVRLVSSLGWSTSKFTRTPQQRTQKVMTILWASKR